jgi:hypothetical protein
MREPDQGNTMPMMVMMVVRTGMIVIVQLPVVPPSRLPAGMRMQMEMVPVLCRRVQM